MKILYRIFGLVLLLLLLSLNNAFTQEYAAFTLTGTNEGSGTFENAALPDFTWAVTGTLTGPVWILYDETFDDGSLFEATFGQADDQPNLRTQVQMNGAGTSGTPIVSSATTTITFSETAPASVWGFCVTDIDVEQMLISANDENGIAVPNTTIMEWLEEAFDADLSDGVTDVPKWDMVNCALLGSDTPEGYTTYNNLVIGGMPSCEAPAAYFKPDIALQSLTIVFENLQEIYNSSYHLYIASLEAAGIVDTEKLEFNMYPNPCQDELTIKLQTSDINYQATDIINPAGIIVKSVNLQGRENTIDVSDLPAGMYFIKIRSGKYFGVKKLLIR